MTHARLRPGVRRLLAGAQIAGAALLIAGCGGSSSGGSSTAATTASSAQSADVTPGAYAKSHHDVVSGEVITHHPANGTGRAQANDDNPARADAGGRRSGAPDPCTLVTQAQAQAILGVAVAAPVQAPLGPTCIYRPAGAHTFVTMTVESVDFAKIKAHIRGRTQFAVVGHTAYCGTYGQPTVFVALSVGRVLAVTAPCVTGARFAAAALPRLGA